MTSTTTPPHNTPALPRIRALLALLAGLIFKPNAARQIETLFAEAEARLARYLLGLAIAHTNNPYLSADMYDASLIWRGATFDIDIRLRPDAIHPFTRIIVHRLIAAIRARALRTRARRRNISSRISVVMARCLRRHNNSARARHHAHTPVALHTPSRIAAPP